MKFRKVNLIVFLIINYGGKFFLPHFLASYYVHACEAFCPKNGYWGRKAGV